MQGGADKFWQKKFSLRTELHEQTVIAVTSAKSVINKTKLVSAVLEVCNQQPLLKSVAVTRKKCSRQLEV